MTWAEKPAFSTFAPITDEDYVCIQSVYDTYSQNMEEICGCHVSCEETTYDSTTSVSKWPSDDYYVSIHLNAHLSII